MTAKVMADYSEHLIAARKALKEAESYAMGGRWWDMARAAKDAQRHASDIELWALVRLEDRYK